MAKCDTAIPADNHLTVGQLVDATPLGKILDTPVADVLSSLKLPPLPALPQLPALPGVPTLPPLNFDVLLKPLTDLLGSFGTGNLSTAPIDPTKVLSVLSQVLESTLSLSSAALRALDGVWSGAAATSATAKTAKTGAETTAVATQGTGMSIDIGAAATIVAAGLATVQGIVVKTVGLLATTIPLIATPVGQGMALGFIATGLAEGIAAVTATRAQLLGPTARMATNGAPVKISGAPTAGTSSPFAVAANLLDAVGTPLKTVSTGLTQALTATTAGSPGNNNSGDSSKKTPTSMNGDRGGATQTTNSEKKTGSPASTQPAGIGTGGAGGVPSAATPAVPLSARPTAAAIPTEPASGGTGAGPGRVATASTASTVPAAMAPLGAAGMRSGAAGTGSGITDHLVSQANGVRVVGADDSPNAPVVLGDVELPSAPDVDLSLIDVRLNLADPPLRL